MYIERRGSRSIVGNIYKARVDVVDGLEAAFVDIGLENAFLHIDEDRAARRGDPASRAWRGGRQADQLAAEARPGDHRPGRQGPAQDQGGAVHHGPGDRRALPCTC
jgi:ribonuclease G